MAYTEEYKEYLEGKGDNLLATWKITVWICDKCGFELGAAPSRSIQIKNRIKAHRVKCNHQRD